MRRRKIRRNKGKHQKMLITIGAFSILLVLTVGYAAFQTNINLNVKGNVKNPPVKNASYVIEQLAKTDTTLFEDGNGNIRYTGPSDQVHNYICLSETDVATDHTACQDKHLYRIIGSFDDVKKTASDATGEKRVKVIKAVQYSRDYWDTSGRNNWARPATLNTTLNTTYYNTLSADAKGVIDSSLWYLGGNANSIVKTAQSYAFERGTTVYGGNATTASGIFALMYPSDYGYASSGCYSSKNLGGGSPDYRDSDCTSSNWLFPNQSDGTTYFEWMLSSHSTDYYYAFTLNTSGNVGNTGIDTYSEAVRPTAYLKSSVTIDAEGRDGTKTNPYVAKVMDDSGGGGGDPTPPTPSNSTASEFIETLAQTDTTTMFNDGQGTNGNIRYTGASADVHNYICLSETDVATDPTACQDKHLYRIIGSFDDVKKTASDVTGEKRVKVIKAAQYSEDYWDTSGSNNWARPATLNTTLNTTYYNTLSADAKGVIDSSLWYLGGNSSSSVIASQAYAFERGTTVYSGNPTTASGIFALMYPSDYGYASSGCKNGEQTLYDYDNNTCKSTDWLWLNNSKSEWMLSPHSSNSNRANYLTSSGFLDRYTVYNNSYVVRPTAHLKSSVTIDAEGRDGTASNPYVAVNSE